jgi:hypothetical protein
MSDAADLEDLRRHWDDAYSITLDPAGKWIALSRLDPSAPPLTAWTARELRSLIRVAYQGRHPSPYPGDQGSL